MVGEKGADLIKEYWYSKKKRRRKREEDGQEEEDFLSDWPLKKAKSSSSGPAQHEIEADLASKRTKK